MVKFLWRVIKFGLMTALSLAGAAKFLLQSRAEPDTEEIDLISIFQSATLLSTASPFLGGRLLNLFAATQIDLRRVQPGPTGVQLDLAVACGGVNLVIPEGWRVSASVNTFAGGVNDASRTDSNPDPVTLYLTGFVVFGGVNVVAKQVVEVVS